MTLSEVATKSTRGFFKSLKTLGKLENEEMQAI